METKNTDDVDIKPRGNVNIWIGSCYQKASNTFLISENYAPRVCPTS